MSPAQSGWRGTRGAADTRSDRCVAVRFAHLHSAARTECQRCGDNVCQRCVDTVQVVALPLRVPREVPPLRFPESFRTIELIIELGIEVTRLEAKHGAIRRHVSGEAPVSLPNVLA